MGVYDRRPQMGMRLEGRPEMRHVMAMPATIESIDAVVETDPVPPKNVLNAVGYMISQEDKSKPYNDLTLAFRLGRIGLNVTAEDVMGARHHLNLPASTSRYEK